jgi:flavin-dependent dehydrogenase
MTLSTDVLIAGGGPAGSTLAALAAQAGARVLLVERATFPRNKVCGEFVAAEGCGVLERLGLRRRLVASGAPPMDACRITDRRGRVLDVALPPVEGDGHEALGVSRERLDTVLLELAERRGARLRVGWEALRPVVENHHVRGLVVRPVGSAGQGKEVAARVVVAADGRRSVLVRSLHPELGDPSRSAAGSWFGLKLHLAGARTGRDRRVELHLFDGGYVGLAEIDGGRINLCLMTTVRALRDCGGRPARLLEERLRANPALRDAIDGARPCSRWHSVGPLRFGVRRPAAAGALFVGDAAGTIDPFCGEGMSHAMRAAELALPIVLAAVDRGGLDDRLARGYTSAWTAAFAPVTRRVRRLGRLLERPRLAGAALGLLRGPAEAWAPKLVAATRTGWNASHDLRRP